MNEATKRKTAKLFGKIWCLETKEKEGQKSEGTIVNLLDFHTLFFSKNFNIKLSKISTKSSFNITKDQINKT